MAISNPTSTGSNSERQTTLGALVHPLGFLTGFVAPALVYLASDDPFTRANARNALGWQLLVLGVVAVLALAVFGLDPTSDPFTVALVLVGAPMVLNLAFSLRATLATLRGSTGTYPIVNWLL